MDIKFGKSYTTHIGVLVKALQISEGDVIELGTGLYSTPLLHWVCKAMGRHLTSYEDSQEYYDYAKRFRSGRHKVIHVKNWDDIDATPHRGLVFIDHIGERRTPDAIRFKNSADYIVIHDTNAERHYGYQNMWPHFKYIYTWKECRPWVSVVSNLKDLSDLA
jgi:hypothetical protein